MQSDSELINAYLNGATLKDLVKVNKTTNDKIKARLLSLGYNYIHADQRSAGRNYNAFSDTNEESCAYFYGLILGDGCLTSKNAITITLKETDISILLKLKDYLKHRNNITYSRRLKNKNTGQTGVYVTFGFSDTLAVQNLIKLGINCRKSGNETVPDCFKFNRHFWRGLIDADGCLKARDNSTNRINTTLSLVSSEECVNSFKEFCESVINCEVKISKHSVSNRIMYACISGQDARKIVMYLYDNCELYLDRKFKSAIVMYEDYKSILFKKSESQPILQKDGTWLMQISCGLNTIREYGFLTRDAAVAARDKVVEEINIRRADENKHWLNWNHNMISYDKG